MTGDGGGRASAGPASYLFPCWTLLRGALHLQREGARSSPAQPQASPCPLPAPFSHRKDRTGQDVSGGAWVEGWGQGAFPCSLPLTGPAQWGHSPACSARQSAARPRRARSTGDLMVRRRLLGLGLPLPARGPVYTLGCGPGARGVCQGYLGVIRPSSAGQTPKDVVVGAAAAWEGPWVWRGRRVGSPRTQLPLGVPGPSEGAAAGPPAPTHSPLEPLLQPQFELCLDSQEGCGGRKGPGGHSKSGQSGRQAATPTVGRGQEPNPGGGAGHALIHPARGQRQAGQARPNAGQACVSGRKREGPSQELSTNRGGAGPGHRPVRWGPWPCPLTGPLRAGMWSAPVGS